MTTNLRQAQKFEKKVMAKGDVTIIRAKVERTSPERTQYKPYSAEYTFANVYVDIPVSSEHVTKEKDGSLILSLAGWTSVLDTIASAVDEMHQTYMRDVQTKGKHNPRITY